MASPIFNALGGMKQGRNNPFQVIEQFIRFKNEHQGMNPQEEINKLLQSGKVSQQKLNELQGAANQMSGLLQKFMNMK